MIALSHFERFGPQRLKRLFDFFGSWQNAWQANAADLLQSGIKDTVVSLFLDFRAKTAPDSLIENLERENIKFAFLEDSWYPPLLREIYAPPPVLYYQGELSEKTFIRSIAVVGTRKATSYGKFVCDEIIGELARQGVIIVSGLALGIDALAHEAALTAGGLTAAVLGSGLQYIYPRTNLRLAERMIKTGGIVMSEYPPDMKPFKTNFPRRNRLIAGLSAATLVIEAGIDSGALITARYALEENRDVLAVPGSLYSPNSAGPHRLIRQGAQLVTSAGEILELLGLSQRQQQLFAKQHLTASPEEEMILRCISREPKHINELSRDAKLDINVINSRLTIMEMKGLIKHLGNLMYVRTKS